MKIVHMKKLAYIGNVLTHAISPILVAPVLNALLLLTDPDARVLLLTLAIPISNVIQSLRLFAYTMLIAVVVNYAKTENVLMPVALMTLVHTQKHV